MKPSTKLYLAIINQIQHLGYVDSISSHECFWLNRLDKNDFPVWTIFGYGKVDKISREDVPPLLLESYKLSPQFDFYKVTGERYMGWVVYAIDPFYFMDSSQILPFAMSRLEISQRAERQIFAAWDKETNTFQIGAVSEQKGIILPYTDNITHYGCLLQCEQLGLKEVVVAHRQDWHPYFWLLTDRDPEADCYWDSENDLPIHVKEGEWRYAVALIPDTDESCIIH